MSQVAQVSEQIKRDNEIRDGETIRMARFVLSTLIDPDGKAAKGWKGKFLLIHKSSVRILQSLADGKNYWSNNG